LSTGERKPLGSQPATAIKLAVDLAAWTARVFEIAPTTPCS
jgi:hypothetical protein